ncbi:flagellar export chaperone FliS [Egibacter rhizosphaerae]|uniref:Flagellar secretion chaperone FliS n=1 Tax=Egibacter rhizosphaerae TaxID=1670831 RepID=A0A411YJD6_9ACTN|nr:flagellar export chaperone FliS [Egibacter rhizosphaerae]QBI21229.1 flagellar export chaperone FliS [Egibacter rhizosphaerae]
MYGSQTPGTPGRNGANPYQTQAVETSSPQALVTMLYDRILTGILRAQNAEPEGDLETIHRELVRTQDILMELTITLDRERGGQIASNLASLYQWCRDEAIKANISKDLSSLDDIAFVIEELRDAWEAATSRLTSAAG